MTDLLLEASMRNPHATIVNFHMYATASPRTLTRFLSRQRLTDFWTNGLSNGRCAEAVSRALGRSLDKLTAKFVNSRHTIQMLHSLTVLPKLRMLHLETPLDRVAMLDALDRAMEWLPNLFLLCLTSTSEEYDSLDLSKWLATTPFPPDLRYLSLTNLWLDDGKYPTALNNKSIGKISMDCCWIGPSGFQALSRFQAVQKLEIDQCDLLYYETDQSLLGLQALEQLDFRDICNVDELSSLFWSSPRNLKLNCGGFMPFRYFFEITQGLCPPSRLKRLEIKFQGVEMGVLSLLGIAIVSLVGLEELKVDKRWLDEGPVDPGDCEGFCGAFS